MAVIRRVEIGDGEVQIYAFSNCGLWLSSFFTEKELPLVDKWVKVASDKCEAIDNVKCRDVVGLLRLQSFVTSFFPDDYLDIGWLEVDGKLCRRFFAGHDKIYVWTISEHMGHAAIVKCEVDSLVAW